ncbi:MAG: single-stranded DNA-binding protein [Bacteroidales bacterium]|nr:single-stranded DNA-binding protein [Bacteroidales bacterium]
MNSLRNRVQLIGNLGQDPEIKKTEKGKSVARFTLATSESYRNGEGQKIEETTWHNIVAWNGLADIAGKFLKKGKEVAVEGRISHRSYEDKDGVQKYFTEIVLSDILLLRSQREQENDQASEQPRVKEKVKEKV